MLENIDDLCQTLLANGDGGEIVEILGKTPSGRVELIISTGQASPEGFIYNQDEDEWLAVLQGDAILDVEGELYELEKGDYMMLYKHQKHRVAFTSVNPPCVWLAVYFK